MHKSVYGDPSKTPLSVSTLAKVWVSSPYGSAGLRYGLLPPERVRLSTQIYDLETQAGWCILRGNAQGNIQPVARNWLVAAKRS